MFAANKFISSLPLLAVEYWPERSPRKLSGVTTLVNQIEFAIRKSKVVEARYLKQKNKNPTNRKCLITMHLKLTNFTFPQQGVLLLLLLIQTPLYGQVLVHQEPRHHPIFENKEIRILNVLLPPGDTTLYHIHTTPSVFITFTTTQTGSQLKGEEKINSISQAGSILVEDLSGEHIRTHRVWNRDKTAFNVMDVELLYQKSQLAESPLNLPDLNLEIDTTWVRVYRLNLLAGKKFQLENPKQSFLLVALQDASVESEKNGKTQIQNLKPGSFIDIRKKKSFQISNKGNQIAQMVLLEFPIE